MLCYRGGWGSVSVFGVLILIALYGCSGNGDETRVERGASPPDGGATAGDRQPLDEDAPIRQSVAQQDTAAEMTAADSPSPDDGSSNPSQSASTGNGARAPSSAPELTVSDEAADAPASANPDAAKSDDSSSLAIAGERSLDDMLEEIEIPPSWLADVQTTYDTTKPWKDARLEIRRLLSFGKLESHREAIKLTWIYLQKDDIGDGHEYPMYTVLGGEPLWSIRAHEEFIAKPHEHTPIHSHVTLASLYAKYGEFEKAKATLDVAMQGLPEPPWKTMRKADLMDSYGDLYAAWGKPDEAKQHYAEAVRLYPTAKPQYGGHLLPRRAAKVQAKLDLLTFRSFETADLRNGRYRDKALGYVDDIDVTVFVEEGKIADIKVRHEEKIDQNACVLIPQWIVEQQSLQVDAITGATVTQDAIINGVYRCLKKAGLQ